MNISYRGNIKIGSKIITIDKTNDVNLPGNETNLLLTDFNIEIQKLNRRYQVYVIDNNGRVEKSYSPRKTLELCSLLESLTGLEVRAK